MVRKEFSSVWNTLCAYYGYKEAEREDIKDLYFRQLKYYDPMDWIEIQDVVIAKCKFMPKVEEISSIANEWKKKKQDAKTADINIPVCECKLCNGTGYRSIIEMDNNRPYEYVVACDCANGDNKLYDGRTIKDEKHRTNYIVPRYSQIIPAGG